MKKTALILLMFGTFVCLARHPIHLTVTELVYKPDQKSLQVMIKVFSDDLELALSKAPVDIVQLDDDKELENAKQFIVDHFRTHLSLKINNKRTDLNYVGAEFDDLSIWCYFEVKRIKKIESIEVENTLFFEQFDDQKNVVQIKANDSQRTINCTKRERSGIIIY